VKKAVDAAGPVDILVNNAGWDMFRPFLKTDPEFWHKIIAINLVGPMNVTHCVLPGMVARGRGKVVNVASDAARVGSSGEAVYAACKGGLVAFSKTIAREHARHGITVNVVCPGPTDTPLIRRMADELGNGEKFVDALTKAIPLRRLAMPDDIAPAIAFLASDDAGFITGQTLSVSGGLTMA
jgi:2-hydroxycyclohexanecarboxyl-CoA dehydrogenase